MPTRHEAIVLGFISAIDPITASVTRELELPRACPEQGLANVVPQDPEEIGYQLGVGKKEWSRTIQVELIVQHRDRDTRLQRLDDLLVALSGQLFGSNLGGLVDHLDLGPPVDAETIPMEGSASLSGAIVEIDLLYETSENSMEIQS